MNVNFYATLRLTAGAKAVDVPLPAGTTVRGLLDAVIERYPSMREDLFDESGALYPHVHVFINGRDAPYLEKALETVLEPTDSVDLFPAIGGG